MKNGEKKTNKVKTVAKKATAKKLVKKPSNTAAKPKTVSAKLNSTKTKTSKKTKKSKVETIDVNIRNIKLTKECRKRLRKVKNAIWGDVAWAIEGGNWFIPMENHNYTHMKERIESGLKEFFELEQSVEVDDFDTDIICYDNHY